MKLINEGNVETKNSQGATLLHRLVTCNIYGVIGETQRAAYNYLNK